MTKVRLIGRNGSPAEVTLERIRSVGPTQGDIVAAAVLQHGVILERTAAGVDADGAPFAPYSDIGPIYINLSSAGGAATPKQRISAAKRLAGKVGFATKVFRRKKPKGTMARAAERRKAVEEKSKEKSGTKFRKIDGVTPIGGITPGGYLKAPSYQWFKQVFLGRSGVDLFGIRAPHMLQALLVRFGGSEQPPDRIPALNSNPGEPLDVELGLYGEEAARGSGHNEGFGALPRRHWLGFGRGDGEKIAAIVLDRVKRRLLGR